LKYIIAIALGISLSACSLFTHKRAPEVVASCFSDGEDQEKMCKSQRVNEENKIVTTRCIGTQNREANPVLRGKCVEKICSEGSNTDCVVKGEMRVLAQYSELVTSNMFGDGEATAAPAAKKTPGKETKKLSKSKSGKAHAAAPAAVSAATVAEASPASGEVDTDPSVPLPPMPEKKVAEAAPAPAPAPQKFTDEEAAAPAMSLALKPVKVATKKKSRTVASVRGEEGYKKVCVAKNDSAAPEVLRGKCATRSCTSGKCSYKGRKEMFEYFARTTAETE